MQRYRSTHDHRVPTAIAVALVLAETVATIHVTFRTLR
jgi:hypothetical protein